MKDDWRYAEDHFPGLPEPEMVRTSGERRVGPFVLSAVVIGLGLATLYACHKVEGRELYPGQYAQVPKEIQEWYKSVRSPNGASCCDIADGHKTEFRVDAEGVYWVPIEETWVPVPREAVVYTAGNPEDSAIVWYVKNNGAVGNPWHIRCFVPNGGV